MISKNISWTRNHERLILINNLNNSATILDRNGQLIFECIQDELSPKEAVEKISGIFTKSDKSIIENDVRDFYDYLKDRGIID